jgi:hypothetical protein
MKISQYMQYLKILQDRYGDIDVKTETNEYVLGVEEDLDNYTDSNFKNNLVYI